MEEFDPSVVGSLTKIGDISEVERQWRDVERNADCSFFLTWGWIGPWLATVARDAEVWLFRATRGSETLGVAVICRQRVARRRGLVRSVQLQLNETTARGCDMIIEDNGVLAIRGQEEACWSALASALRGFGARWDELSARSLNRQATTWALSALAPLRLDIEREFPGWVLPLQSEDAVEGNIPAGLRKKTRQQVRQSMREFAQRGPLTLERPKDVREALEFFAEMDELHTARWERVAARGSFANPRWVAFHRAVIEAGVPTGAVTLLRVRVADETIGVVYGFLRGARFLALQTGFRHYESTALRSGFVSHALAMQHLASAGITAYDFLPDSEDSYKRLLAEPENLYTTLRFQRPRLRFLLERTAVSLRSKGVVPATQDSSTPSPTESP